MNRAKRRLAEVRSASVRFASIKLAPVRSQEFRLALVKSTLLKLLHNSFAFASLAKRRSAWKRLDLLISLPERSADSNVTSVRCVLVRSAFTILARPSCAPAKLAPQAVIFIQ